MRFFFISGASAQGACAVATMLPRMVRRGPGGDTSGERAPSEDEFAYEPNWYRVLRALSRGEAVELGEAPDPEFAILIGDPEADRPAPVRLTG